MESNKMEIGLELAEIREHLDRLDNAIITILSERMSFIPKVALYKHKNNIERYQPDREKSQISRLREIAMKNKLDPDLAEDMVKLIISYSHKIQKDILKK